MLNSHLTWGMFVHRHKVECFILDFINQFTNGPFGLTNGPFGTIDAMMGRWLGALKNI